MCKPQRVFRNHYICPHCDSEFSDEMLVISSSFCPACDAEIAPYSSEAMFDPDLATYDDAEEETV